MKKTYLTIALTLTCIVALNALPEVTHATTKTTGDASFSKDDGMIINPIKPGTEDDITPENPTTVENVDGVRLVYVPKFNFGMNKTALTTKNFPVKQMTYGKGGTNYEMPQFVQVADLSGKEGTIWTVTAEQTAPLTSTDTAKHVLTNSRIKFKGATVTNNLNNAEVADMVTPVTASNLPVKDVDGGALTVFSSKGAAGKKSTNGTISSMVFKSGYVESDYKTAAAATLNDRGNNADVELQLEQNDKVQTKDYQAEIVWTLTVTP